MDNPADGTGDSSGEDDSLTEPGRPAAAAGGIDCAGTAPLAGPNAPRRHRDPFLPPRGIADLDCGLWSLAYRGPSVAPPRQYLAPNFVCEGHGLALPTQGGAAAADCIARHAYGEEA